MHAPDIIAEKKFVGKYVFLVNTHWGSRSCYRSSARPAWAAGTRPKNLAVTLREDLSGKKPVGVAPMSDSNNIYIFLSLLDTTNLLKKVKTASGQLSIYVNNRLSQPHKPAKLALASCPCLHNPAKAASQCLGPRSRLGRSDKLVLPAPYCFLLFPFCMSIIFNLPHEQDILDSRWNLSLHCFTISF